MNTEARDPRYVEIDRWPTSVAVAAMIEAQISAVASLQSQTERIAEAAEGAAERLGDTGRLVYVGAGTSGRLAVQDGAELFPTFGWPHERLAFLMAGGIEVFTKAAEMAEDDADTARQEIAAAGIGRDDVVIGVAASGRTPYTLAAITSAREAGALTIGVANNPGSALLEAAEIGLLARTGAEVIAGSTRMKAGTAQKVLLNTLSTAIMLRRGLVYDGMMVNMKISNEKLQSRAEQMVQDIARVDTDTAAAALDSADLDIKLGVLLALGLSKVAAIQLLHAHKQNLRQALNAMQKATANA
ncbi:N-acetylmuramic acid 6-phosphate etherase [Stakelama tenebrarum]|uniref:N-acetylmuramic acid 6-phosphate etherase n=1 Tax=Stakelama tenebrarum TaxID=2711215 RepID=A0A6G6Y5W6_9SPHN|nr:N-acetylmuramic acid 6-phosphate etherase [Sphingosinithalassobacter tenebrarum]QIG80187.1 N-acetylmuramic acid 6-phosphate etherase [Sphingosinithalassobacter tenebrarum]